MIQEGSRSSRRSRKVQKGSGRHEGCKKVLDCSRMFYEVIEDSKRFKKILEGSRRFKEILEGSRRFNEAKEVSI